MRVEFALMIGVVAVAAIWSAVRIARGYRRTIRALRRTRRDTYERGVLARLERRFRSEPTSRRPRL